MNYRIEDNPLTNLVKISCVDNEKEIGYLEFSPPISIENYINIQNIIVEEALRRNGIGTGLIDYLKKIARKKYNSITIRVMDIHPIDNNITINDLKKFYIKNGFQIYEDKADEDVSGVFNF